MSVPIRFDQLDRTRQEKIRANLATLEAKGASDDEIESYLRDDEGLAPTSAAPAKPARPVVAADATARHAPGDGGRNDFDALKEGAAAIGTVAGQAIPGMEPVQAFLRSKVRGQTYREALDDMRHATNAVPLPIKMAAQAPLLARAIPAAAVSTIPKAMAASGAVSGAHALLNADPDKDVGERIEDAAVDAATGATLTGVTGGVIRGAEKVARGAKLVNQVRKAEPLGAESLARKDAIGKADAANYGAAEAEAAANGGTSSAVQSALSHPKVKPLADEIRESFRFQGLPDDDASILLQLHRELSSKEGPLIQKITGAPSGQPISKRHQGEIQTIKRMLRDAASDGPDALMPSFKSAVAEHAELAGDKATMQQGAERGRDLMAGKRANAKKPDKQSEEATMQWARNLSPEDKAEALPGVLAVGKESMPSFSPTFPSMAGGAAGAVFGGPAGFGVGAVGGAAASTLTAAAKAGIRLNRLAPLVSELTGKSAPVDMTELQKLLISYLSARPQ